MLLPRSAVHVYKSCARTSDSRSASFAFRVPPVRRSGKCLPKIDEIALPSRFARLLRRNFRAVACQNFCCVWHYYYEYCASGGNLSQHLLDLFSVIRWFGERRLEPWEDVHLLLYSFHFLETIFEDVLIKKWSSILLYQRNIRIVLTQVEVHLLFEHIYTGERSSHNSGERYQKLFPSIGRGVKHFRIKISHHRFVFRPARERERERWVVTSPSTRGTARAVTFPDKGKQVYERGNGKSLPHNSCARWQYEPTTYRAVYARALI